MNLLKDAFLGAFSVLGLPKDRAVILMYHSVTAGVDYFMNVEPTEFEKQMAHLKERGYPVITLSELARRIKERESLGGSVVITFDDGYRDNYTVAFPILKHFGFPATIFVTTDLIGKTDKRNLPRLTIEEMKEMEASGLIDIEPHTKSHPHMPGLTEADARAELGGSKTVIENMLGKKCHYFAYPYGDRNEETDVIVAECGFEFAVSVKEGTVYPNSNGFRLPRVSIDSSTTPAQFRGKLTRAIDYYNAAKL